MIPCTIMDDPAGPGRVHYSGSSIAAEQAHRACTAPFGLSRRSSERTHPRQKRIVFYFQSQIIAPLAFTAIRSEPMLAR